jgi:hypothetical protein
MVHLLFSTYLKTGKLLTGTSKEKGTGWSDKDYRTSLKHS